VKKAGLCLVVVMLMLITAACGQGKSKQLNTPVEPFQFMNQDERLLSLEDLRGKVWVADLVFTYCSTVCPTMTANMADLQKRLKAEGVEAELVSFSVDPERDDPAALKSYLSKFNADFTNWHALTGYDFNTIKTFVLKSFRSAIAKDQASDQVIHGTSFYLVNAEGNVVAKYDGMTDTPYDQIIKDIKALQG